MGYKVYICPILKGKGVHMNALERFHIYEVSKQGMHLNDTFTNITTPVFETLTQAYG
jgi:hypothetical protein